ncbi:hypothetical protein [Pseudorhodobacter antarcticus]|jgi:hypothetical protein|nr:hypothetical protein [Pseudorhodobacter antarcticus]
MDKVAECDFRILADQQHLGLLFAFFYVRVAFAGNARFPEGFSMWAAA